MSSPKNWRSIKDCIEQLKKRKFDGDNKFIQSIRFPFYRNIEPDTQISFKFPYTVFTGKNGSGKSSVMQALYGCPYRYTLRDFWFSTAIDPITDDNTKNEIQHRFVYSFYDTNEKNYVSE